MKQFEYIYLFNFSLNFIQRLSKIKINQIFYRLLKLEKLLMSLLIFYDNQIFETKNKGRKRRKCEKKNGEKENEEKGKNMIHQLFF